MNLKDVLIAFIAPLAVGILTFFLGIWWANKETRIQYLDYYVTTSTDLLKNFEEKMGDSARFSYGTKRIKNLSEIDISIFNNTNKDFENVPIYIELFFPDGKVVPIFSDNFYDHNNRKQAVEVIPASESINKSGKVFSYNLKTVNRLNKRPVFKARFLIDAGDVPQYIVQTTKPSVEIREFDLENIEKSGLDNFFRYEIFLPVIGSILTIIFMLFIFNSNLLSTKRSIEYQMTIMNKINEENFMKTVREEIVAEAKGVKKTKE